MNTYAKFASVLLATYEMPRHLEMVLAGLERQSVHQFEIILCDDGSGDETRKIVQNFKSSNSISLIHVWQEHRGFRKCRMLNEGIRKSKGDWLIFLDGDCVPHRDFVRDHLEQSEAGVYLAGRRVELGQKLSDTLDVRQIRSGALDFPSLKLAMSILKKDSTHFQRSMRVPWKELRRVLGMEKIDDLKGCNFSVSRRDMEKINGFDEAYEGYGREDTDVEIRLKNLGLSIKSLKGLALQYHVWHPRREFTPMNDARLEELKKSGRSRCEQGLLGKSSVC